MQILHKSSDSFLVNMPNYSGQSLRKKDMINSKNKALGFSYDFINRSEKNPNSFPIRKIWFGFFWFGKDGHF